MTGFCRHGELFPNRGEKPRFSNRVSQSKTPLAPRVSFDRSTIVLLRQVVGAILLGIRQVRLGEHRSERFLGVALLLGGAFTAMEGLARLLSGASS
jgi:hypothetical protein